MRTTLYLKGGGEVVVYLDEIKVNRSRVNNNIVGLTWTPLDGARTRLLDIDLAEIAAITTEKERSEE